MVSGEAAGDNGNSFGFFSCFLGIMVDDDILFTEGCARSHSWIVVGSGGEEDGTLTCMALGTRFGNDADGVEGAEICDSCA